MSKKTKQPIPATRKKVYRIAKGVRDHIMECENAVEAMCGIWSVEAAKKLKSAGFSVQRVQGVYEVDFPDEDEEGNERYQLPHHWLEVDGLVVDGTASQFEDWIDDEPPADVVIGTYDEEFRYTPIHRGKPRPWGEIFGSLENPRKLKTKLLRL